MSQGQWDSQEQESQVSVARRVKRENLVAEILNTVVVVGGTQPDGVHTQFVGILQSVDKGNTELRLVQSVKQEFDLFQQETDRVYDDSCIVLLWDDSQVYAIENVGGRPVSTRTYKKLTERTSPLSEKSPRVQRALKAAAPSLPLLSEADISDAVKQEVREYAARGLGLKQGDPIEINGVTYAYNLRSLRSTQ